MITVESPAALADAVGQRATGDWFTVDQPRITAFADATEDHQWIHLDVERAADGPFGGTIAHGYLTLALLPRLTGELLDVGRTAMAVNYGLDTVRFLTPVPAGGRVRATVEITGAEPAGHGVRLSSTVTVELEGAERPALVAQTLALYVPGG
ncbi:acyl dehydratase [Isoptericola jiangsuensis]|uniref:Acyl dehydratase n=1 Tax=Isoptericola jiangsuensis TaxID=548579 RepID=A0A2A9EXG3_9MICO|nr:MaoC family dehydratase [Isoptericola jiangsuensis]PFG43002.1 acyl dehydratase [Isoptericola jiangsuensis]